MGASLPRSRGHGPHQRAAPAHEPGSAHGRRHANRNPITTPSAGHRCGARVPPGAHRRSVPLRRQRARRCSRLRCASKNVENGRSPSFWPTVAVASSSAASKLGAGGGTKPSHSYAAWRGRRPAKSHLPSVGPPQPRTPAGAIAAHRALAASLLELPGGGKDHTDDGNPQLHWVLADARHEEDFERSRLPLRAGR